MPGAWRDCLRGEGPVDLRGCNVLSEDFYLWSGGNLQSKMTSFLASKMLRGKVEKLPRDAFPAPFAASFARTRDLHPVELADPVQLHQHGPVNSQEAPWTQPPLELSHARVDQVACPADYAPASGLSGDRETATAQAVAESLQRAGITQARADRSLPLIYAHHIQALGIELQIHGHHPVDLLRRVPAAVPGQAGSQPLQQGGAHLADSFLAG